MQTGTNPRGVHTVLLSREAFDTNLVIYGLNADGTEPTIFRTRGVHTNHVHHIGGFVTDTFYCSNKNVP
jgi:hypothetical protein